MALPDIKKRTMKKAYELSYALFRVSEIMKSQSIAEKIRQNALSIIEGVAIGNKKEASDAAMAADSIIRLASDVGYVSPSNSEILIKELGNLNMLIAELEPAELPDLDISKVFGKEPGNRRQDIRQDEEAPEEEIGGINSETRQAAIVEKIRQIGNSSDGRVGCRLRELQEYVPGVSERPLRYDLKHLIDKGIVERVGSGGPSSYYKLAGKGSGQEEEPPVTFKEEPRSI